MFKKILIELLGSTNDGNGKGEKLSDLLSITCENGPIFTQKKNCHKTGKKKMNLLILYLRKSETTITYGSNPSKAALLLFMRISEDAAAAETSHGSLTALIVAHQLQMRIFSFNIRFQLHYPHISS